MKNLLVPVDFSDVTDRVIANAEELACAFGAKIWMIHCVNEYPNYVSMGEMPLVVPAVDEPIPERFANENQKLEDFASRVRRKGIPVESLLVIGTAVDEILAAVTQYNIDLIIMGSHGHGSIYELMVGTVTKSVLNHATRPVLVVPSRVARDVKVTAAAVAVPDTVTWEEPVAIPS